MILSKFIFITYLLMNLNSMLWANSIEPMAIKKHLSDAIIINKQRAPLYAKLTNNQSLKLSYELILIEMFAKVLTRKFDLQARIYVDQNVLLFNEDLINMSETPDFKPYFDPGLEPKERVSLNKLNIKKYWFELIEKDDLKTLYNEAVKLLNDGELKLKNQNCLTRHYVESIARGLLNIEHHQKNASIAQLNDPKKLLLDFVKLQITSIQMIKTLDQRAYKIQKLGIPIFCQDVPQIPYE